MNLKEEQMKKIATSVVLALTPAVLFAQTSARAQAQSSTSAEVKTGHAQASSSTTVDAEVAVARERGLPTQPIRSRAAEARAKGHSELQAALAARRVRANLEAAHEAMIRAGREQPQDGEVERGGYAIERGYTSAQIEAVAKSAPSDRSLVVAFDVLSRLAARGVPTTNAIAQVQSRLEARAPDAQITALAATSTNVGTGAGRVVQGTTTGATSTAAGVTAGKGTASVTGTVTGAVSGVVRKP
jgi:hypothetical protein